MPADARLQFQPTCARKRKSGGHVPDTDWNNKAGLSSVSGLRCTPTIRPPRLPLGRSGSSNANCGSPRLFGLLVHAGSNGKRSKMEAIYCPAWEAAYGDGGTSHLISGCGGTVSFTKPFVHPGSLLHYGLRPV